MNAEEYILSSSGLGLPEDGTDHHNNNQAVMNEKVQSLAGSIYEEFESMIIRYDTDVVKSLMPLIVNVLESLDLSYTEIQEYEVELELLKEDNEQLVTQYEREKALRKGAESKNIEFEDNFDGERKDLNVKIESITSTVKMFELKAKNNQEHINRLEEKENEMKREYSKLHDRYTELFKTHIDYMERAKNFLGSEKMEQMHGPSASSRNQQNRISALNQLNRSSGPISFGYTELEGSNPLQSLLHSGVSSENCNSDMGHDKSTNLRNELIGANDSSGNQPKRMVDKGWVDNGVLSDEVIDLEGEDTEYITQDPNIGPVTPTTPVKMGLSQTKVETRTGNTLYQELSFQDADALGDVDEGADITDHDFDDSSCFSLEDNIMLVNDNYFGMGKEVENLISENNELLATKNALNIVKDDLIAKVDELTGEHEILREEIKSLQKAKSKGNKNEADDEDVPMAQTQEIYTGRNGSSSHGEESTGRLGIWKFFGNLFSANDRNFENGGNNKPLIPYVNMKYSNEGGSVSSSKGERKGFSSARNNELFDGESLRWNFQHTLFSTKFSLPSFSSISSSSSTESGSASTTTTITNSTSPTITTSPSPPLPPLTNNDSSQTNLVFDTNVFIEGPFKSRSSPPGVEALKICWFDEFSRFGKVPESSSSSKRGMGSMVKSVRYKSASKLNVEDIIEDCSAHFLEDF
ncbi:SPAG9 [Lepeophtheirus salmonis]|uniref:JNK-interacting protein 3 n=1 Tax=Lepeophtheirus salmonis TaxID=72036 RepID=A0A7R8CRA1_LEPSM|nr:SPAG9 [Lepeophtheirus salmonis]CAF2903498.1 SPAG9 [Lepeophtheirus salmonis]